MLRVSEFKQRKSIQLLKTCICWSTILNPALVLIYTLVVIILQYSIIIIIREIWCCVRVRGVVGPSVVVEFTQKLKMDEDCHSYNQL